MPNTFDAALIAQKLSAKAITVVGKKLAPLRAFTTDFSDEVIAPQGVVNVPVAINGSATLINPDNFEQGDGEMVNAKIEMKAYSQPFHITSKELNSGARLEQLAQINLDTLCKKLQKEVFTLIKPAKFGAATTVDPNNYDYKELQKAWGLLDGGIKNAVLGSTLYAPFLPKDELSLTGTSRYGFDVFAYTDTLDGLAAKTQGFVCSPAAMAIATAIPENRAQNEMLVSQPVYVEDLGMTLTLNIWVSRQSRALWGSYDVAFGAVPADSNALKLLASA